ncbi:Protein of unknown function, partial [Gryllus bimaculatus]
MSDPVVMDTNDLETEKTRENTAAEEENLPNLTPNMDESFLVDESYMINEDFPGTSDEPYEFAEEKLDIDHGEFAEEMDYTEEIRPLEMHSSKVSEQEVPSDNAVQARSTAQEAIISETEVQQSVPGSTQSVPVTSLPNVSKEPTYKMTAHISRVSQGMVGSASTSANALHSTSNLRQLYMLQKMMNMRQVGILQQRMNVPNLGSSNLRMMHNITGASQLSLNQQQMNFLRLGVPRLRGLPVGWVQNRMGSPRVHLQAQRSQLNLRFPQPDLLRVGMLQGARSIPPIHTQTSTLNKQQQLQQQQQQKLLQLELQQQQLQKQQQQLQLQLQQQQNQLQLQHQQQQPLMQQGQALQAQLNILRNIRAQSLTANTMPLGVPQGVNASPINISQNVAQGRTSSGCSTSSQQRQLPAVTVQPAKLQPNVLNVQQRMNVNPLVPDISQLSVNTAHSAKSTTQLIGNRLQVRVPQIPSNILQLRAPQPGSMPHLQMQQLVAKAQQLARNVAQLNPPRPAANMLQVGTSQLSSNVPTVGIPQVVSNVPRLNIPSLGTNIPQILRNVQQLCLQQQATNTSQLHMRQLSGNISSLCAPQSPASNLSSFNVPLLTTNVPPLTLSQQSSGPRLGIPLPPTSVPNLGLRAGMSNLTQINIHQSASNVSHLNLQPNVRPSAPQIGIPELLMNLPQATNVPQMRTTGSVLHLGERYQKTAAPRYERLQRLEVEEKQQILPRREEEPQDAGAQQKVTGVTQQQSGVLQQSVNSSQQSASAPQAVDGQKRIASQSEKEFLKGELEKKEAAILKRIQKRRVRQQLALLNLWKRYERYRVARGTYGMKRKKIQHLGLLKTDFNALTLILAKLNIAKKFSKNNIAKHHSFKLHFKYIISEVNKKMYDEFELISRIFISTGIICMQHFMFRKLEGCLKIDNHCAKLFGVIIKIVKGGVKLGNCSCTFSALKEQKKKNVESTLKKYLLSCIFNTVVKNVRKKCTNKKTAQSFSNCDSVILKLLDSVCE